MLYHFGKCKWDAVITEYRVIDIEETPNKNTDWSLRCLAYYIKSLVGEGSDSQFLRTRNYDFQKVATHPLAKFLEELQYIKNRNVSKYTIVSGLLPLGLVPVLGWSAEVNAGISNAGSLHKYRLEVEENPAWNESGVVETHVFTGGGFAKFLKVKIDEYPFDKEDNRALLKVLNNLRRNSNIKALSPTEVKADLLKEGAYTDEVVAKRSFFKEVFAVDALALGYSLESRQGSRDGKSCRVVHCTKINKGAKK